MSLGFAMRRSRSRNNLSSQDSPQLGELAWTALALTGLLMIGVPAARAEERTSIQVRFSGVVHAPCYGTQDSPGANCQLSRTEESVSVEETGLEQPLHSQTATSIQTEAPGEIPQPNLVRQVEHGDHYRRITLTPS